MIGYNIVGRWEREGRNTILGKVIKGEKVKMGRESRDHGSGSCYPPDWHLG